MKNNKGQFKKGQVPWNKGKTFEYSPRPKALGRKVWNKGVKTGVNMSIILKGRHLNPATEFKKGEKRITGENNPNWRGDQVGYSNLHKWVSRHLGKPKECDNCRTKENRIYHWANISGEYKRDLSDWIRLCVPCHHEKDHIHEKIWQSRRKY